MNTWIVADNDVIGGRIRDSLQRHGVECPLARTISLESIDFQTDRCSVISGVVLVAVTEVDTNCFDAIRRLRLSVQPETIIALISSNLDRESILNAIRLGCNDFLNFSLSFDKEVAEFLTRVQVQLKRAESTGRFLTVIPSQSARDANIFTVNLAAAVAANRGSCGILDFHFQGGDLALLLKLSPRHTVIDLLHQPEKIDESMFAQAISRHERGIELLAGPTSCSHVDDADLQECPKLLLLAQQSWEDIIINVDNVHCAERSRALAASNEFILTIRPDVSALHRTQQQIDFLVNNEVNRDQIHIAVMGTGYSGELSLSAVKKLLRVTSVHFVPDDQEAILVSTNIGNPLVLEMPKSKMAIAIKRFAESTLGYLERKVTSPAPRQTGRMKAAAMLALNTLPFCK